MYKDGNFVTDWKWFFNVEPHYCPRLSYVQLLIEWRSFSGSVTDSIKLRRHLATDFTDESRRYWKFFLFFLWDSDLTETFPLLIPLASRCLDRQAGRLTDKVEVVRKTIFLARYILSKAQKFLQARKENLWKADNWNSPSNHWKTKIRITKIFL